MTNDTNDTNEPWFDIERRLRDDPDGQERDNLLQRLNAAARNLKQRMNTGGTPKEFAEMVEVYTGLEAAIDVVDRVWQYHRRAV